MEPQDPDLYERINRAAWSAQQVAADAEAKLAEPELAGDPADQLTLDTLRARAEDLLVMLRREAERATAGVAGGPYRSALIELAAGFFTDATSTGVRIGMDVDRWGLDWLSLIGDDAFEAEQQRQAALAQIAEARAQVIDLVEQAQAQSDLVRLDVEETRRERLRSRLGLTRD